jgi:hypothetical protein
LRGERPSSEEEATVSFARLLPQLLKESFASDIVLSSLLGQGK